MKRNLAFILAITILLLLALTVAACGNGNKASTETLDSAANIEGTYNIADYYNGDGRFSELGRALPFAAENGEKALTVKSGDVIIVGDLKYSVTEESLTLYFYTQPSLDEVFEWWADYFRVGEENGIVIAVE